MSRFYKYVLEVWDTEEPNAQHPIIVTLIEPTEDGVGRELYCRDGETLHDALASIAGDMRRANDTDAA